MEKGKDFVVYHATGGESLLDIARLYTLSAAYWEALADFGGAPEWRDAGWRMKTGEAIAIPISWLNDTGRKMGVDFGPGINATTSMYSQNALTVPVTGSSGVEFQRNAGLILLAIGLALAAFLPSGKKKRRKH